MIIVTVISLLQLGHGLVVGAGSYMLMSFRPTLLRWRHAETGMGSVNELEDWPGRLAVVRLLCPRVERGGLALSTHRLRDRLRNESLQSPNLRTMACCNDPSMSAQGAVIGIGAALRRSAHRLHW